VLGIQERLDQPIASSGRHGEEIDALIESHLPNDLLTPASREVVGEDGQFGTSVLPRLAEGVLPDDETRQHRGTAPQEHRDTTTAQHPHPGRSPDAVMACRGCRRGVGG
jgi:hypothetical protein